MRGAARRPARWIGYAATHENKENKVAKDYSEQNTQVFPRLTQEQARALDSLNISPRAVSLEADFEQMTWTFKIEQGCSVGGGTYALVWIGE
jgi:hypothetical protein